MTLTGRLREVAAEVGFDHSNLHHYFTTKQDLVDAVVDCASLRPDTADKALRQLERLFVESPVHQD